MMALSTRVCARLLAFGGGASIGVLLLACSSPTDEPLAPVGTDAAAEASARPPAAPDIEIAPDAAASCNDLAFEGATVVPASPDADAGIPPSTGGVLTDGTYVLVSLTDYAFDPTGIAPVRETARVNGTSLEVATERIDPVGVKIMRARYRVTTNGTVLSLRELCSDPPTKGTPAPAAYTATASTFSLQFEGPAHAVRWAYQRKP